MADRFPTQIRIGGQVNRAIIPELLGAINAEGLQSDWGSCLPDITSEEQLLEHMEDGHLTFRDEERAWGEFADLEQFLVENGIPFNRSHCPRYEYDGELVQFRTGMEAPAVAAANDSGVIVIEAPEIQRIRDILKTAQNMEDVRKAMDELNELCFEADIEPLPAFEIVVFPPSEGEEGAFGKNGTNASHGAGPTDAAGHPSSHTEGDSTNE